jgi:hypothetical protein
MNRGKILATVLVIALSTTGSFVAAAPMFGPEAICRAAIASIKGRDPKLIKVARAGDDVFFLRYTRPADKFDFVYRCRVEANRVVWADEPGRWRNEPKDDKISFEAIDDGTHLQIFVTNRNGLTKKHSFDREKIQRSGAEQTR